MATARRKEKEKEQRRTGIIDAAEKLFFERGYDDVSMDDVAKATELAKGTLYLYFKNKESLFFEVVLRGASIMSAMFKEGAEKEKTGADKLYAIGAAYYAFYRRHPDYFKLFTYAHSPCFMGVGESAREVARMGRGSVELMCECVRLGQADGTVRKDIDPVKTAWFLIYASESAINKSAEYKSAMEAQGVSQDELVQHSIDILGRGFLSEKRRMQG